MLLGVHANHYARAEDLIVQHGNRKGLRTLDALQLAVALDVQARVGLDAFVGHLTADKPAAVRIRKGTLPFPGPRMLQEVQVGAAPMPKTP